MFRPVVVEEMQVLRNITLLLLLPVHTCIFWASFWNVPIFYDIFSLLMLSSYLFWKTLLTHTYFAKIRKWSKSMSFFFYRVLRLEFCHDLCEYYTELDAVCLHGEDSQGNYILSGLEGVTSRSRIDDISNVEEKFDNLSFREQVQLTDKG